MKLVGYVRVSTQGQKDNSSIPEQIEKLNAYAKAMNHELVAVFSEVESGKSSANRPEFQKALLALEAADGLIATKLDRIARSTFDLLKLVEETLKPKRKELILLDMHVDTSTPAGSMFFRILAAINEFERETIRERCTNGKRAKASQGGYIGGLVRYGNSVSDGEFAPNTQEQEAIELMRRHRRSGKSYREIAVILNEKSIPTRRGKQWQAQQVSNCLERIKV